MSLSAGTGSPLFFRCPRARRESWAKMGTTHDRLYEIKLTGKMRPYNPQRAMGLRSTFTSFEYECECGHTGWSNHIDMARKAKSAGLIEEIDR